MAKNFYSEEIFRIFLDKNNINRLLRFFICFILVCVIGENEDGELADEISPLINGLIGCCAFVTEIVGNVNCCCGTFPKFA